MTTTVEVLTDALQLLAADGCHTFTQGSCRDDGARTRGARFSAEAWCQPCVAQDALDRAAELTTTTAAATQMWMRSVWPKQDRGLWHRPLPTQHAEARGWRMVCELELSRGDTESATGDPVPLFPGDDAGCCRYCRAGLSAGGYL